MYWKLKRSDFDKQKGDGNRKAMETIVNDGKTPGILAYVGRKPVGWCAVEPRENYAALERSRILKPVDQAPVWSIPCFFVAKDYRKKKVTVQLLLAAIDYVRRRKGKVLEGYPIDSMNRDIPAAFAWTGFYSAFAKAGFVECIRRSETRPIMRCYIPKGRGSRRRRRPFPTDT